MRGWTITFHVSGGCAADGLLEDVTRAQGDEVHGVVYRFGDADLERIAELAGEGTLYERVEAVARTYAGSEVPVVVYVGRPSRREVAGRPSEHRLRQVWRAAEEMQLAPSYVQALCMDYAAGPRSQTEVKSPARLVLEQSERIYELVGHDNFGSLSESMGFLPRQPCSGRSPIPPWRPTRYSVCSPPTWSAPWPK